MAALRQIPRESQGGRRYPSQALALVWGSQRFDYVQHTVDEGRDGSCWDRLVSKPEESFWNKCQKGPWRSVPEMGLPETLGVSRD